MDTRSGREIASDELVQLAVKLISVIAGGRQEKLDVVTAFDPKAAADPVLTALALVLDVDRAGSPTNRDVGFAAERHCAKLHRILRTFRDLSPNGPSFLEELGLLFEWPATGVKNS